ncbi:DUF4136 domain-containing protein [Holophaga foetida]|uniref:DUF4136 domain-containing protein n=1 Tax=Holophaga foetida TaxID=35839 RepID=UPI0002473EE1|nr:DUF4136 domain-containing protein [Holophaga foetida]
MRLAIPLSALFLGTLIACSPLQVKYDYDARADYAQYHSFDWEADSKDTFTERRIRAAVEKDLTAKGFRRAEGNPPDLLVSAYPVYRDERVRSVGVGVGIGLRILPGVSVGVGTGSAKAKVQTIGGIVMAFKDTRNSQLIWKAETEDALEEGSTPEESEEAIQAAVTRMLERFPPEARPSK